MKKKEKGSSVFTVMISTLMSMVLCACLLFGTTYAWFTASVTSDVNIIKTGTFNIDVLYSDAFSTAEDATWSNVEGQRVFDVTLGPGGNVIRYLKIVNTSAYTISVQLSVPALNNLTYTDSNGVTHNNGDNSNSEVMEKLLKKLKLYYCLIDTAAETNPPAISTIKAGNALPVGANWGGTASFNNKITVAPGTTQYIALALELDSNADSGDLMGLFKLNVVATQVENSGNP